MDEWHCVVSFHYSLCRPQFVGTLEEIFSFQFKTSPLRFIKWLFVNLNCHKRTIRLLEGDEEEE